MLTAEVSIYPVEPTESDDVVMDSLRALDQGQLQYDIGSLSTHVRGEAHSVWDALRSLHEKAQDSGHEVVMVVTLSNS